MLLLGLPRDVTGSCEQRSTGVSARDWFRADSPSRAGTPVLRSSPIWVVDTIHREKNHIGTGLFSASLQFGNTMIEQASAGIVEHGL